MNRAEEQHAGVVLAKPPPMLKSIREKDLKRNRLKNDFCRVFVCLWAYLGFLVLSPFIVVCCVNGQ